MKSLPFRITLIVAVMLALAASAFFMANVPMPDWTFAASAAAIILFAIPAMWATRRWLGRDWIGVIALLGAYAVIVETIAIYTGHPYGTFEYSDALGFKLFGVVPWTVAFAWTPLILGSYAIAANVLRGRLGRIALTAILLVVFDLVLDPGAVYLGFWRYEAGGDFYGVPFSNFAGWLLTGAFGALLLDIAVERLEPLLPTPIQLTSSAALIIFFWSSFDAFAGMFVPATIGFGGLVLLAIAWRKFYYAFDDKIVLVTDDNVAIGTATKLDAHNSDTKLHRAFSVFVFNSRGELLLQQRALSKKTWPGVWSNSCCGHVMLHETTEHAAARRLKYELGLRDVELVTAIPDFRYRAEKDGVVENEICPVLIGRTKSEPTLNRDEVESTKWLSWDEFVEMVEDPASGISPWAVDEVRLLAESDVFKQWFAREIRFPGKSAVV